MELVRFYCEELSGRTAELDAGEARHAGGARRLAAGDRVELFNGRGTVAAARIESVRKSSISLEIEETQYVEKGDAAVVILCAVAKGERFDWVVEKCTELGVNHLIPVVYERTVKQASSPKAVERWGRIAVSAAKQSRGVWLPEIQGPVGLEEALSIVQDDYRGVKILVGGVKNGDRRLVEEETGGGDAAGVIGPEGGFTEGEEAVLRARGGVFVRLTDTVLRVETAAAAFAAVLAAKRDAGSRDCPL